MTATPGLGEEADLAPNKTAQTGTQMLRRSDAMGVIRKALGVAHADREKYAAENNEYAVAVVSKKIAAYYAALSSLAALPVFVNAQVVEARRATLEHDHAH